MATLAEKKVRSFELGDYVDLPVVAADVIYEGAAVGTASGNARPLVAGDRFAGFADGTADNALGAAAAIKVKVRERGKIQLPVTGVVAASLGAKVYASDDDTFTLTQGSNSLIGYVTRVVAAGVAVVQFEAQAV